MEKRNRPLQETTLPLKKIYSGKVRELYDIDEETMLLTASDRVSAFDFVLPTLIPGKGGILTRLSVFWFRKTRPTVENHLVEDDFERFPAALRAFPELRDRSIIVRRARRIDIECVVRGYLAGGGWKEYLKTGGVCGVTLPGGMKMGERLPDPIFTPATKEEKGTHDVNIGFEEMRKRVGTETAERLRDISLQLYEAASEYAEERGIIIADTKFEFGYDGQRIILIDEILTPDSSRFWKTSEYTPGKLQKSLDKQYIRDYLESLDWNKEPPVPELPEEVVRNTAARYREIYEILTGEAIDVEV